MAPTRSLVFYSWQTDLPNATNRSFIEKALENAAKAIKDDDSIQVEPVIDRDTSGVPGSPDIAETIFGKIDQAHIFVGDISIINQGASSPDGNLRPTPNPNVLLELGYALKALGDKRILLVLNDAYGGPEFLPFDLRMRRVIRYHMPHESEDRATERKRLERILAEGIRTILSGLEGPLLGEAIQPLSLAEQARLAIEAGRPDQTELVQEYMTAVADQISALTPKYAEGEQDHWDDQLVQAIGDSQGKVVEFAQVAKTISRMNAAEAARTMYKGFAGILELYRYPPGFQGVVYPQHFDLARFLGHELFVSFISFLIEKESWGVIADLLDEDLYVRSNSRLESQSFGVLSDGVRLLMTRNQRLQLRRRSLHFDLLNERHAQGALAQLVPMEQFADADYFLFLRAQVQPTLAPKELKWWPWSTLDMAHPPRYLAEASNAKYAQRLLGPLGVEDIPTLRTRLAERMHSLGTWMWESGYWTHPMARFDPNTIGSR